MAMEDREASTLIKTFFSLGQDAPTCLRLFSRGGAQSGCFVVGSWAAHVAADYVKSSAVLAKWPSGRADAPTVDVVALNDNLCRDLIRDCLLRRGASVELYERNAGGGAYVCIQRGSPGNIADFEATLFDCEEAEVALMASGVLVLEEMADGRRRVGLAALNTTLRHMYYAEYVDGESLASLDALLSQISLKELTWSTEVSEDAADFRTVRRMCERVGATLRAVSRRTLINEGAACASGIDALRDLLRVPEDRINLTTSPLATQAMELLLHRVDAMDLTNHRAFYLRRVTPTNFMKLDSTAVEALHIISRTPETRGALPQSIFAWLQQRCSTGMGARTMRQWLLQPLRHREEIEQRQTIIRILVEQPLMRDQLLTLVLRRCGDMDRLNRKLQRRHLNLKDTQAFLTFVRILPEAIAALSTYRGQDHKLLVSEYVAPLEDIHEHMANLITLIEATVDFSDRHAARIQHDFDDDLANLHAELMRIQAAVETEYAHVRARYKWGDKQLRHEYHNTYGYVFKVSRKDDQQLRANSNQLRIVSTSKDGIRFVSDALASLSEEYRRVDADYDRRQSDLKHKLMETLASYLPVLDDAKELLASLDVLMAWALTVCDAPRSMVCPIILDEDADAILSIKGLRHPLVELRQPNYTNNSVLLSNSANAMIITGPNMGGKSTFMRSVGVAVVLAQAGCYVPAEHAELKLRDAVMCRVGANDHLSQGVSTFMMEMLESSVMLSGATSSTLAIVDELGRGTSTFDGFGLAWAIAQEIAVSIRAALLFSTHFHELTQLADEHENIINAHFGADVDEAQKSLRFRYALEPGACGRSYGLYVAALAELPDEVLRAARHKAEELEGFGGTNALTLKKMQMTMEEEEVVASIARYAKDIREMEHGTTSSAEEAARLRQQIAADEAVLQVLRTSA